MYILIIRTLLASCALFSGVHVWAMVEMHDDELAGVTGQALMQMGKETGTGISSGVTFYKAGLDVSMDLNMNIEKLQLGCTASTTVSGQYCDIDIRNLGLSGAPTSFDANGNGIWAGGRTASQASLLRPYFQFAIKNDGSKTLREVLGVRFSAESISGMLTAGTENRDGPSNDDGIQSLSGFMRIKNTTGQVTTQQSLFGKQPDEQISGNVRINVLVTNYDRGFTSIWNDPDTQGVTIPAITSGFTVPDFQVNGKRQTQANIDGISVYVPTIPMSLAGCAAAGGTGCVNQLRVQLSSGVLGVTSTKVRLRDGSRLDNLYLNATFNQDLSMIHNVPLSGTGMYLSFQKEDVFWPGAYVGSGTGGDNTDIARAGWWMSFQDQVDLGYLQGANQVDISAVYPQVATLATQFLQQPSERLELGLGDAIDALFDALITTPNPVIINLNNATNPALGGTPATITLENLKLVNQEVTPNCWGTVSFC